MTTYEPLGERFKVGDSVMTYDFVGYKEGYVNGKVTGVSDEGITVKWDDLNEETEYDFFKIHIFGGELIIEHDQFIPASFVWKLDKELAALRKQLTPKSPPPALQEQAQAYADQQGFKLYPFDNDDEAGAEAASSRQYVITAFLAGHAQASGEVGALRSKLKVATDVLTDITGRYDKGEMAHMLASDGLKQIQEK